jgi:sugar porter (SP) family MFS transporter
MDANRQDSDPSDTKVVGSRFTTIASILAGIGGLLFGYDTGIISGALIFIKKDFGLTSFQEGLTSSILAVGAVFGAIISGPIADRVGRKRTVLVVSLVFAIGGILAAVSPTVAVLVIARFIIGLSVGSTSVLVPMFIAEIAPPDRRGRLVVVNQLMITVGILVAYLVGYAFSGVGGWRWMFGLAVVPAAMLAAGMSTLPETPRWLMIRDRLDEARTVLRRLRGGTNVEAAVDQEMEEIRRVREEGSATWKTAIGRRTRPLLVVGLGIQFLGQLTGVNAVIYYAPTILHNGGLGASASILATTGVGAVNLIMTIVGMNLIDRIGRRALLFWGLSFMTPALVVLGLILGAGELHGAGVVIAIVCLLVYIAAVAVSVDTIVFVIPSEIYPLRIRGKAMGMTLVTNWGMNFVVTLAFLPVMAAIGSLAIFLIFAALCLILLLFTRFVIPETKGRSLEELEEELAPVDTQEAQ